MNREEILTIKEAIEERGLMQALMTRLRIIRPNISKGTVERAWEVECLDKHVPAGQRLVLTQARLLKEADDRRINEELSRLDLALTREMVTA